MYSLAPLVLPIVWATRDLPPGTTLTASDLAVVSQPIEEVVDGSLGSVVVTEDGAFGTLYDVLLFTTPGRHTVVAVPEEQLSWFATQPAANLRAVVPNDGDEPPLSLLELAWRLRTLPSVGRVL